MIIQFIAVGKQHDPSIKEAVDSFTKRISNYFEVQWIIVPPLKNAAAFQPDMLKKKEADSILKFVQKEDYLIALDENGRSFNSLQFAKLIQDKADNGSKTLSFVIGGAFGLHELLLHRANLQLSFSALTFPHQVVRLLLAEQVYRACTIQRNEKYHHS